MMCVRKKLYEYILIKKWGKDTKEIFFIFKKIQNHFIIHIYRDCKKQ